MSGEVGKWGSREGGKWGRLRIALLGLGLSHFPASPLPAQDPTGHWRTLETAHFNVHVRDEYRDVGVRAAAEAEQAWSELSALLPPPGRRVELVVADNVDDPNGYATTYPLPHIVIYAIPPAGDLQLAVYDRWLRLVIVHELTHLFHLDRARGIWAAGRSVFGRAPLLFPNNYTPPWMREGLAVFYESRITGEGRLEGAFHRAVVRAAAEEQGGLRLDAANTPTPKWPAGIRAYAFGATVMGATAQRRGDSAIVRFVSRLATLPFPYFQLGAAWKGATGETIAESWGTVGRGDGGTGPDGTSRPAIPPSPGPPLFTDLRLALAARVSHDSRFVAFAHNDGRDVTRLMVFDRRAPARPDGSPPWRRIARLNPVNALAWLPDGAVLASQLESVDAFAVRGDLWRIGMDGRSRQLTRGMRLREADAASDGAIVAVRVVPGGNELVLAPAGAGPGAIDPARWRVIAPSAPGVEYATPRFDPGGRTLALVRVENGWHDIVLMSRDGGLVRQVTHDRVPDLHPAFTADGSFVVWSREVDGTPQLVGTSVLTTGDIEVLTTERYAAWYPAPVAGDSILYVAYHAGGFRLVAAALAATGVVATGATRALPAAPEAPAATIVAEHGYHAFPSVLPQYWIPQFFLESGGAWLGALSSGSDALDRHAWGASVLAGLGSLGGKVQADAGWSFAGLRNLVIDASVAHRPELYLAQAGPSPTPATPGVVTCCAPNDAFRAGVTFVRRRLRSQGSVRVGLELSEDRRVTRRGVNATGTWSHLAGAALGISPQDGWRLSASVRYRQRVSGGLHSTQIVLRGIGFSSGRSGTFARQVFGVRGAFGVDLGSDRQNFSVGGVSSSALDVLPGVALGGSSRTFQVRGYAPGTLAGRRAAGITLENRLPIALVDRGIGMLPLGLDRISGSLFTDAGMAWNDIYCPGFGTGNIIARNCASWIWSVGAEFALDLGIGYEVPLRLRLGSALRIRDAGRAGAWVALGSSF